jgi:signal transduction histidine kinase
MARGLRAIGAEIERMHEYERLGLCAPEWVAVRAVAARAAAMVEGLPITIDVLAELEIVADPIVGQVFQNLFDNTRKHAGPVSGVTVRARDGAAGLVIAVEDDGIGIPAADKERVFERGVGHGTGIGLFLVREILGITGIAITETGEAGRGARFELHVPPGQYRFVQP